MTPAATGLEPLLFLVSLTNGLLSGLLVWTGRTFPGAKLWVGAQGLVAAGALIDVLPFPVPPWFSTAVGNTIYLTAGFVFAHAIWAFRFSGRFPRWLYLFVPAVLVSFWLVLDQPYLARTEVFTAYLTITASLPGVFLIWNVERQYRWANSLTALPFLVLGGASAIRLVFLLTAGSAGSASELAAVNQWYVYGAIFVSIVTLFGYFMMTGIRAEQILSEKDEEIEARSRKLAESARSKDLFFSIIAHDLRGPIGGAARYVRKHLLGKMTGLEAKYTEVETLAAALEKTYEFLEKLLWWSRSQLQDWTPELVPLDLDKSLDTTLNLVQSSADMKEIKIVVPPPPYPRPVADPESVQLILANLLSNAVKFSLPGRTIRLIIAEELGLCRITVQDEGVGMDQATLDRLFKIEDKLTTHGTSGERGSGLGLLLAQSLAERNRGGVTIESDPGIGTRATLWLPTPSLAGPL